MSTTTKEQQTNSNKARVCFTLWQNYKLIFIFIYVLLLPRAASIDSKQKYVAHWWWWCKKHEQKQIRRLNLHKMYQDNTDSRTFEPIVECVLKDQQQIDDTKNANFKLIQLSHILSVRSEKVVACSAAFNKWNMQMCLKYNVNFRAQKKLMKPAVHCLDQLGRYRFWFMWRIQALNIAAPMIWLAMIDLVLYGLKK